MDHHNQGDDTLAQLASLANGQHDQHDQRYDAPNENGKRKNDDGQQGPSKSRRSRYVQLACNECKRRKIKCNGQTPCQRCGNLNLECVYAAHSFKDSPEYKDMAEHITGLQGQVNMLFQQVHELRTMLGVPTGSMSAQVPSMQQQLEQHLQEPPPQIGTSIDPSLHGQQFASFTGAQSTPGAQPTSPVHARDRRQSQQQQQPSFRGPMSTEFSLDVAKSSLQTMGITQPPQSIDASAVASPNGSQGHDEHSMQLIRGLHEDKDPIWRVSRAEALRLCRVYEDEMGMMYPLLNREKVMSHAELLYTFMDAMRRNGIMQEGMPGADAIDDEDATILKLVMACALTTEGSGRSDLGDRLVENVQQTVDRYAKGPAGVKGIQAITLTAMYEFHRANEDESWRIIGEAGRSCLQLGLHRHEIYNTMANEAVKSEAILLFWSIYVLDRRWSFGTGKPFVLQDNDIDPLVPRPEDRSPYLSAMIKYCEIGSKVWQSVVSTPAPANQGGAIKSDEMGYLDYQVIQWHRNIPPVLRFEHPLQQTRLSTPIGPPPSRAGHRLRVILYLRAAQMRIHIYRPVLHSATSIMQNREQAQTVIDVAKDAIRVLSHINQTTDLYRTQQVLFNAFLTSALAVLFLAVSHTPAEFANNVRDEFYMALDLVRGFSKGSYVSKRLWKTIRGLKDAASKLGLTAVEDTKPQAIGQIDEADPNRNAAVAMAGLKAGLAAHGSVDESHVYTSSAATAQQGPRWLGLVGENSSSPENMADDLTRLFEAAGVLGGIGQQGQVQAQGQGQSQVQRQYPFPDAGQDGGFGGTEGLSGILKELF